MKLAALVFVVLLGVTQANAAEDDNDQAVAQLREAAQCQAIDMSLMQMYNSIAASIDVLSPKPPSELERLRDSYRMLADAEAGKVHELMELTKRVLLPNFEPSVGESYLGEVGKNVAVIQKVLNLAPYDKQKQVQTELRSTSGECETFVQQLAGTITY